MNARCLNIPSSQLGEVPSVGQGAQPEYGKNEKFTPGNDFFQFSEISSIAGNRNLILQRLISPERSSLDHPNLQS